MLKSEAIAHYGGNVSALARALDLHQSAPYSWLGDYPPPQHQIALERITGGALKAEPECRLGIKLPRKAKLANAKQDNGKRRRSTDTQGAR